MQGSGSGSLEQASVVRCDLPTRSLSEPWSPRVVREPWSPHVVRECGTCVVREPWSPRVVRECGTCVAAKLKNIWEIHWKRKEDSWKNGYFSSSASGKPQT